MAPKTKMTPVEVRRDLVHQGIEVDNTVPQKKRIPRGAHVQPQGIKRIPDEVPDVAEDK